jgi:hypothetical protein
MKTQFRISIFVSIFPERVLARLNHGVYEFAFVIFSCEPTQGVALG